MEEFNLWDLKRVNVKVDKNFFNKLTTEIDLRFKSRRDFYNQTFDSKSLPFSTFRNFLKRYHSLKFFIPLEFYLKIIEKLDTSKEELQRNIISYKTASGINFIENPILPIKIDPVFHMIFAHNIGDGTVINPKNGRLPYFGYRQFDEFYRIAYVRKLEHVFGKIIYPEQYFMKSTRSYAPAVISSLFFKYYKFNIENFLSDKARIPDFILKSEKDNLLAILIAFIIDEGHVDSTQIVINLKNGLLVVDLKEICDTLAYDSKVTQAKSEIAKGCVRLHILRKGMKKLYEDYRSINKCYPVINLGWKGDKIKRSFEISSRPIIRTKGNAELILKLLEKEPQSINQLAERINMTRQGVRFHIHNLLKQDKIKSVDKTKPNWEYKA